MPPEAVIFDLDGLLIDTEWMWESIEAEVFAAVGVDLSPEDVTNTTGLRVDEVVHYWYRQQPWNGRTPKDVETTIVDRVAAAISARGVASPGAFHAIDVASGLGAPLAVASSSPTRVIDAALTRLAITPRFDAVVSAEHERLGKPDPGVYLTTAHQLGVDPTVCVALEDSPNGVRAAKAAGMRCIAVPTDTHRATVTGLADLVLASLEHLTPAHLVGDMAERTPSSS